MGTPIFKVVFDRQKRASRTKEGSIELRITYNRIQRFATTGVRVLPSQWHDGRIVNRMDSFELQHMLDMFVAQSHKVVNEQMEAGMFDMDTIVSVIGDRMRHQASENVPDKRPLMEFFTERATIRKYGRATDSQTRYERFLKWFEKWGGMLTFADLTELNIIKMDKVLTDTGMCPYSKWNNYHRFLNSFILDAINEGIIHKNPYKGLHIEKESRSDSLDKCLTKDELERIMNLELPTEYLRHARDLFVFQTYTCLSYTDLASFDASKLKDVNGRPMYIGKRGKTNQEFVFLLLTPARKILEYYGGKLPIMSNQRYNQQLKNISVMAGVNKPVSSHWARHTGATLLLNSGVDMEVVSRVMGHASTKITRQIYAKLLDETVAKAMEKMTSVE